jgi:putative ABC transport system permease protein
VETFLQDLRFGFRNLMKTRGLTAVAIITLALGIGANTAIFSVIDAVLLRPLPFSHPGELVRLYETEAAPGNYPFTGPDFFDWKTQNKSFQDMTLYSWGQDMNLSDNGRAERVIGNSTESNFFTLLGARPLLGRTWAQGEDVPDSNLVILSYGLWQTHFGGDANILNRTIELNAKKFTVVGVMPPSFRFPSGAQLWTPQPMDLKTLGPRGSHSWRAIGRLKPGVSLKQAQTEMSLIASRLEQQYPDSNHKVGASLVALHEDQVGSARDSLIMMLWAVALVLLIACANVANLLLSRSLARQKEMAIRSALGAARMRLVRQLLTESVLLAATGGVAGLALAWAGVRVLANAKHLGLPRINPIELNVPVMAFTLGVAVLSGIVFGIIPALQTSRPDLHDELKGGAGASVTHSRARHFASNALVVGEMGLSLLLLIAAGLLLKDFATLRNSDVGVRTEGVWTAALRLPNSGYKEAQKKYDFAQALLARLKQIPGVESAALSTVLPTEGGSNYYAKIRGKVTENMGGPLVEVHAVTPGYFHAMGIPLISGRDFTPEDVERSLQLDQREEEIFKDGRKPSAEETEAIVFPSVINQAMAKAFWPDENPIGKFYAHGSDHGPWHEVVGVVGDTKQWGLVHAPVPEGYDAFDGSSRLFAVLHTSVSPAAVTDAVRHAVTEIDSNLPLFEVRTMDQVIAEQAAGQQFTTTLVGLFAGLALLLAAVGIYGVLSYLVTQRTREIGIRMSLGAGRSDVLRLVLGHGARLAIAGCLLGVIGAFAATRVLRSVLLMAKGQDVRIFLVAVVALVGVALFACYVPARRATKVDPVVALRYE